jgi:hypothetical protein
MSRYIVRVSHPWMDRFKLKFGQALSEPGKKWARPRPCLQTFSSGSQRGVHPCLHICRKFTHILIRCLDIFVVRCCVDLVDLP